MLNFRHIKVYPSWKRLFCGFWHRIAGIWQFLEQKIKFQILTTKKYVHRSVTNSNLLHTTYITYCIRFICKGLLLPGFPIKTFETYTFFYSVITLWLRNESGRNCWFTSPQMIYLLYSLPPLFTNQSVMEGYD